MISKYINENLGYPQLSTLLLPLLLKNKFGKLALDESYGFFPLLPLGGKKDVYHMDKVKTREHIELIAQLVGKVGMD